MIGLTFIIGALLSPVATKMARRVLLITGNVNVILLGGGFGESVIGATHTEVSCRSGWPGNKEHVWPSGPIPRSSKSNLGMSLGGK